MKPTWGSISRDGFALTSAICDTLGFYSRSVQDLEIIADVFRIADLSVPQSAFKIAGAKIGFAKTPVWPEKVTLALEAVWSKAKDILSHHGANVEEVELPGEFSKVPSWHAAVLATDKRTSFLGRMLSLSWLPNMSNI
jgi:Asp-tRNA(Asn)/Glu-tRNA(Gln) amidotransferase A subunit family amidase